MKRIKMISALLLLASLTVCAQTVRMFYNPTYSIVDGKASATLDIGTHVVPCKISTPGVYVISMNVGGSVYEKKIFLH